MDDKFISFNELKLTQIAKKYDLKPSQVNDMYLFTLDDYELLDRACKHLSNGETRADVARRIVMDWW